MDYFPQGLEEEILKMLMLPVRVAENQGSKKKKNRLRLSVILHTYQYKMLLPFFCFLPCMLLLAKNNKDFFPYKERNT